MSRTKQDTYLAFVTALAALDGTAAKQYISSNFQAVLKADEGRTDVLNLEEFIAEVKRMQTAFPKLGASSSEPAIIESSDTLNAVYRMSLTFSGPLKSRDGKATIKPTGRRVEIHQSDKVTFNREGKIVEFIITSNMTDTMGQMFP